LTAGPKAGRFRGMDFDSLYPQLESIFRARGVVLAYLFGSQATGQTGPGSDVDIAVLLGPDVPRAQWFDVQLGLMGDLLSLFQRNDVDVVILNRVSPLLAHEVVTYGQVIYEDEETRPAVDFAVRTLQRYVDTAPLRRLRYQYLTEWIEERRVARAERPTAFRW